MSGFSCNRADNNKENEDSADDFMSDDLVDDFGQSMSVRDYEKMASKVYKEGFIEGKSAMEKVLLQEDFDSGFEKVGFLLYTVDTAEINIFFYFSLNYEKLLLNSKGITLGRACGRLYGHCRTIYAVSDKNSSRAYDGKDATKLLKDLEQILFHDIPENDGQESAAAIQMALQDIVAGFSTFQSSDQGDNANITFNIDLQEDMELLQLVLLQNI